MINLKNQLVITPVVVALLLSANLSQASAQFPRNPIPYRPPVVSPISQERSVLVNEPVLQSVTDQQKVSDSATAELQALITSLAREHIPHDFEDKRKWGMQKERWDGLKWERSGLKIETRARKKLVNHGRWTRYKAWLLEPDRELNVRVEEVRRRDDDKIQFQLFFVAKIGLEGEVSKWVKGVKMYSFGADAAAQVGLRVVCLLDTSLDFKKLPPDLVFEPEVTQAELSIIEFDLQRVGEAGGEVADQLGRAVKKRLEDELEEKSDKLVKKANAAIEKKKDKLRLSASDLLASQWADMADRVLPATTVEHLKESKPKE